MKKRFISIILTALLVCTAVCGCSGNENANNSSTVSENSNQNSASQDQNGTVVETESNVTDIDLYLTYNYSEDLAWVIFNKGEGTEKQQYCGCIDKSGNLVFYIDENSLGTSPLLSKLTPYSNGYSYIETSNSLYLLNKSGTVLQTYPIVPEKSGNKAIAYADGYVWYQEYVSDFDEAYYKYSLYDSNKNIVTEFEYEGTEPIESMGYYEKKVWAYYNRNKENPINSVYFTDGNKWIDSYTDFYFYDDIAIIGPTHDNEDTDVGYLSFIDSKGNQTYTQLPDNIGRWNDIQCYAISDDYCVLYHSGYAKQEYLAIYNVSTKKFIKMDNKYNDKIDYDSLPDDSGELMFENGKIALRLIGSDGDSYVGLFDTSWNIIGEPIKSSIYYFSDGKLVTDKNIYDENVKILFSADDFGYKSVSSYHNGIAHAKTDGMQISSGGETYGYEDDWFYIDSDGNRLFDSINMKSAIKMQLQ